MLLKLSKLYLSALSYLLIAPFSHAVRADSLSINFNSNGLQSIRYAGVQLLGRGNFQVNSAHFLSPNGRVWDGATQHSTTIDSAAKVEKLVFGWGNVVVRYLPRSENLVLNIATTNTTKSSLQALSYDVLALHLPVRPLEYNGVVPLLATNIGAPSLLPMTYGRSGVLLSNEDVRRPLLIGFPWALDKPADQTFPLRINTGRENMYPDSLPFIDRPIAPGATDNMRIALRFSAAPVKLARVAPDLLNVFARGNPFTLHWPDRRPIGSLIIATAAAGWRKNPRGWLLDPNLDVTTPSGIRAFRTRLLAWADQSVSILKRMNAQGMVTWDIEGEQFPHPTTYIGDPRLAETLAPEMSSVLDEYFARFTRAGLRVGITIRPQTVVTAEGPLRAQQTISADPAQVLMDKIAYAKKRWGATLFYIDSNGDQVLPLTFDVIRRVANAYPDVLLMPEHKNALYYSKTAPYSELRGGYSSTPELVRDIYPDAFSVINIADGPVDKEYSHLQSAVARGDILMFRAWFNDPVNVKIKKLSAGRAASRSE